MKYIDKSICRDEFDEYTKQYLNNARKANGSFFPELASKTSYEGFSNKKYKTTAIPEGSQYNGWLDLLLKEQENRCCYCMRELKANEVSVEHLVPESFKGLDEAEEYAFYSSKASTIRDYVITGNAFDKLANKGPIDINNLVKMPHLIAHSNLFPACNTECKGCTCNNNRGNKRILPLMLMEDVDSWMRYDENGELLLTYHESKIAYDTISHLDINTPTQKETRHLWYRFSRKKIAPEEAKAATFNDRERQLTTAFDTDKIMNLPSAYQKYFTADPYWEIFLQYNWFYTYYLDHYPL